MSPTERSPLLDRRTSAEDEPSWLDSYRWLMFSSWLNLLLPLVPVAAAAHYLNWDAPLRFGSSFLAIIPLAKVRAQDTVIRVCPALIVLRGIYFAPVTR
jgi:Ca2+:H+ antiporter